MISDIIREVKANYEKLPQWEKDYIKHKIDSSTIGNSREKARRLLIESGLIPNGVLVWVGIE